jgi:hypothetical protein
LHTKEDLKIGLVELSRDLMGFFISPGFAECSYFLLLAAASIPIEIWFCKISKPDFWLPCAFENPGPIRM